MRRRAPALGAAIAMLASCLAAPARADDAIVCPTGTQRGAAERAGGASSAVDFGPDGKERSRRAWDDEQRAVQSSLLIHRALRAASVGR